MSVVPISPAAHRPAPPANLTPAQKKVWKAIVNSTPVGWFVGAQEDLLTAYVRHVVSGDLLSTMIDEEVLDSTDMTSLRRYSRLLGMRQRETAAATALATKMRLTQQAKMHPRSAGRAFESATTGPKPWEYR
jgi:hypothetical protein